MECNKDEATRAKRIAEDKFTLKDIAGAKKFALKAQTLFPALEGIQQMISTLDVYLSAQNKINGESDFYAILNVSPQADEDTVRRHYRKLALLLHPDKNKSIGAEGAFKFISQAWSLLSDKTKRLAYDQMTATKTHKATTRPSHNHKSNTNTKTFWTVCHGCKMQYEYLRLYLNHNLLCPNCQQPFFAVETPPPPITASKSSTTAWDFSSRSQSQWAPFCGTSGGATSAAEAATVVQQAYEKVKRDREEAQAATKREEALKRKHVSKNNNYLNIKRKRPILVQGIRVNGIPNGGTSNNLPLLSVQNILMKKAKTEIRHKLNEWTSNANAIKNMGNGYVEAATKIETDDPVVNGISGSCSCVGGEVDKSMNTASEDSVLKTSTMMSMNVPDSDFHDFDKDRTERAFKDNQVWAAYDDDDGMPRYYALIQEVVSLNPFEMRISWLNSKTNSELGPLNWVGSGFSKTCGDFRVGKYEMNKSLNSFSHKVGWRKGARGTICIFPRKGEVWALYRNWCAEWNELTADEVIHKYEMVEVIEEAEGGVIVIPLVKVEGLKSVFHRHLDVEQVRRIRKEEMFRFSHQVPSHLLTGKEGPNAPRGCRELDPAATPLELLWVIRPFSANQEKDITLNQGGIEEEVSIYP